MAHGTPDFSQTSGVNTVYQLTDMGELAARLGSIVTFDRRGDVLLLEDFESGLSPWQIKIDGANSKVCLSLESKYGGRFSCKLTADAAVGKYALIFRPFTLPSYSKYGFEYACAFASHAECVQTRLIITREATSYVYSIRYFPETGIIMVETAEDVWETIDESYIMPRDTYHFIQFKLVIDSIGDKFVRFILSGKTVNLSNYSPWTAVDPYSNCGLVEVKVYAEEDFDNYIYLDNLIVTQNEP